MRNKRSIIAVLSGKGGTGKTLVSVNLASAAENAVYIDCDVEEPNGHLFFKPENLSKEEISVKIPVFDETLCTGCKKCADFCKFNALAIIKGKPYLFGEVCHSCGGCALLCPEKAVNERDRSVGIMQQGVSGGVSVRSGLMNAGEASGIPIIKKLLSGIRNADLSVIIDCPPGSACAVMESISDADYCILVAEPTIFGVHNLNMVVDLVVQFGKRFGVVLNKCVDGANPAESFCTEKQLPILAKIPYYTALGSLSSDGKIAVRENSGYKALFADLLETVRREVPQ